MEADDSDSGQNGMIEFLLHDQSEEAKFTIDPDTGHLSTAAQLDRETVVYLDILI